MWIFSFSFFSDSSYFFSHKILGKKKYTSIVCAQCGHQTKNYDGIKFKTGPKRPSNTTAELKTLELHVEENYDNKGVSNSSMVAHLFEEGEVIAPAQIIGNMNPSAPITPTPKSNNSNKILMLNNNSHHHNHSQLRMEGLQVRKDQMMVFVQHKVRVQFQEDLN